MPRPERLRSALRGPGLILTEGAVIERLRRDRRVPLDPDVAKNPVGSWPPPQYARVGTHVLGGLQWDRRAAYRADRADMP